KLSGEEMGKAFGGRGRLVNTETYQIRVDCPDHLPEGSRCYENRTLQHWEDVNIFGHVTSTWTTQD
ncbi:MAG: hypothetical protein M0P32_06820, partial [Bacteroidales bacterium]|nr:hypothetical protein [Bacteroidales bacterium]